MCSPSESQYTSPHPEQYTITDSRNLQFTKVKLNLRCGSICLLVLMPVLAKQGTIFWETVLCLVDKNLTLLREQAINVNAIQLFLYYFSSSRTSVLNHNSTLK